MTSASDWKWAFGSHADAAHVATGVPQVDESGFPLFTSAGMLARFHLQMLIPALVQRVANTPPPAEANPARMPVSS